MQLVIIDLVPALLSWEGRDSSGPPEAAAGALGVVGDLFTHFRLTAVADGSSLGRSKALPVLVWRSSRDICN